LISENQNETWGTRPEIQYRKYRHRHDVANAPQHFLFSEPAMKEKTRDTLIYLAVGLGIVALIVADLIYAGRHSQKMWWPSRFASRAVYTSALLAYFVARETRKLQATLVQVLGCLLFSGIAHLAIIFALRQTVDQLSGLVFSALAVFEMFLVFELTMVVVRYLMSE
jgi:hypothetical protein